MTQISSHKGEALVLARMRLVGRRVLLLADHPHATKTGTVIGVEKVAGAQALKVQLDGAYAGEAFAFPGDYRLT